MKNTGYEALAEAILKMAKYDYQKAVRKNNRASMAECEQFFRSQWFEMLTGCECHEEVIRHLKETSGKKSSIAAA